MFSCIQQMFLVGDIDSVGVLLQYLLTLVVYYWAEIFW